MQIRAGYVRRWWSLYISICFAFGASAAWAQAPSASPQSRGEPEKVDVDAIKRKYWDQSQESELRVIQNRIYTKKRKFEVGFLVGTASEDPFLNVKEIGGSLGFHFNDTWALEGVGWKFSANPSSALDRLQAQTGKTTNYNAPKSFMGGDVLWSPLYGKLSLLGKAIIHFDMHAIGGAGVTDTQSGKYFTPYIGLGQQIFLTRSINLRLDYRLMEYKETILEQNDPLTRGNPVGQKTTFADVITIGFTIFLGPV